MMQGRGRGCVQMPWSMGPAHRNVCNKLSHDSNIKCPPQVLCKSSRCPYC